MYRSIQALIVFKSYYNSFHPMYAEVSCVPINNNYVLVHLQTCQEAKKYKEESFQKRVLSELFLYLPPLFPSLTVLLSLELPVGQTICIPSICH